MYVRLTMLSILIVLLVACSSKEKPVYDPNARQAFSVPGPAEQPGTSIDVSQLENVPGFTSLPEVEQEIFRRTISLQMPYYEQLERWANDANTIQNGRAASRSLRMYIARQDDFAEKMQALDEEFRGKIDPNYTGSKQFEQVIDAYMNDPVLQGRIEYILQSYMSLLQRFRDDPECREVFADLERMAREAQQ